MKKELFSSVKVYPNLLNIRIDTLPVFSSLWNYDVPECGLIKHVISQHGYMLFNFALQSVPIRYYFLRTTVHKKEISETQRVD